ncbi:MAG: hypothetical protein Q7U60_05685 [Candidatus Methanoperedens sp.]|nr:hypothetical protein [Candidatus Methanoperedens sp.]
MNNWKNTNVARILAMGVVAALVIVGMAGSADAATGNELITNGAFSNGLSGWTIQEWYKPSDGKGEVTAGSDGIRFRSISGNTHIGIMQTLNADVSGCTALIYRATLRADEQTLSGTGYNGRESPISIFARYTDINGVVHGNLGVNPQEQNRMFWTGLYFIDPTGSSISDYGIKTQKGVWYNYETDLMKLSPKPKTIDIIGAEGAGWPIRDGKVKSISLTCVAPVSPTTVPPTTVPPTTVPPTTVPPTTVPPTTVPPTTVPPTTVPPILTTPTQSKFRVGPSVTLRPVTDVIEENQDGIVELFMNNPSLNDVTLNVDAQVSVPAGLHVSGENFGQAAGAGVVAGTFSVPPGKARTISITIKADKSARKGSHTIQFTGLYYPGDNKDAYQPLSLTYSITVKAASKEIPEPAQTSVPAKSPGFGMLLAIITVGMAAVIRRRKK